MAFLGMLAGAAIVIFFVIVVPWLAIAGRRDARVAREGMDGLKLRMDQLFHELETLRAAQAAAPAKPASEPFEQALERARKTRAAAKAAGESKAVAAEKPAEPAVAERQDAPAEQSFMSPWKAPAETAGLMRGGEAPAAAVVPAAKKDFEEVIGTRWAIWVGGVALALGSLFLVRYTIEAGLLGPAARLILGFLFSVALIAAGEALRRGVMLPRLGDAKLPVEHAPLALTAAGTVGLFGVVYAAHALYGF
ncbi:MAG: DUF2339 domain-containing protein, partial [Beijerinckiaceae bacterium]